MEGTTPGGEEGLGLVAALSEGAAGFFLCAPRGRAQACDARGHWLTPTGTPRTLKKSKSNLPHLSTFYPECLKFWRCGVGVASP